MSHVTLTPLSTFQDQKVKGQLVADVLNSQYAGVGATWRINTKILLCRNITATWRIKYEDIVNLQEAEAYRGGRLLTACYAPPRGH